MKKIFLIIVFCGSIYAQELVIGTSALHSVISGYTMYYQIMDRNAFKNSDPMEYSYSRTWHTLQTAELVTGIGIGVTIGLDAFRDDSFRWDIAGSDLLIAGSIRWLLRDGVYEMLLGRGFWYQSKDTTAQFEYLGTPLMKISFVVIAILIRYLLIN